MFSISPLTYKERQHKQSFDCQLNEIVGGKVYPFSWRSLLCLNIGVLTFTEVQKGVHDRTYNMTALTPFWKQNSIKFFEKNLYIIYKICKRQTAKEYKQFPFQMLFQKNSS